MSTFGGNFVINPVRVLSIRSDPIRVLPAATDNGSIRVESGKKRESHTNPYIPSH